jgi:hypothetical protein
MRKTIQLPTQEELLSLFDYKDGGLYWKTPRRKDRKDNKAGSLCPVHGYRFIRINKIIYREHRLVWKMVTGKEPQTIDHINRIRHDNRIENLREVTDSENCYNSSISSRNTSGVRGVHWCLQKNKWRVYINVNKKRIELGRFSDFELAALVAEEARDKYHRVSV